ncbi:MAG: VWA domain-containing protein [Lachnospiraceae bacterium]|nr:VWA domain-containing protein [Lachnospiraceae bacterium]
MKRIKKLLCLSFALLTFAAYALPAYAAGEKTEEESPGEEEELLAPYFIIQTEDCPVDLFPLKSTEVTTNINGVIAETYVVQTYANEGDTPINARYVFPTSSDVTMHGMKMEIGNNVVVAKIKEKEEAKTEYEEAKSEGKSASLLEQKRPNVFTMDVANIMPGDTARIELHYTELISSTDGICEFSFPTVVGPRYAAPPESEEKADAQQDDWVSSPYLADGETPPGEYLINVNLSTGVPIAGIESKSHEIKVEQKEDSRAEITLANPEDYAGNRDFILNYKLTGEEVESGLMLTSSGEENYFMLTVQPPERFTPEEIPPREYIFVLDVSGSMMGYPLDTAKLLIRDLVTNLKETDKFNLILFANETFRLSPESLPATAKNIRYATEMIDEEMGGGGTSMMPALEEAVDIPESEDFARSVVIITDGYVSNEDEIFNLINNHMDTSSFFSFGIGSSVNDYLIKGIAQCGMGEAFVVTNSEDAESSASRFRTYIESPLLTGMTIDYEGFDVYDVATSAPSILYAQKPVVLFGKWKGEPSGTITITGKSGEEDYVQEIPVNDVTVDTENEAIRYLWARTKLDQLAGYGSVRNDESVKDEITQIGLDYNMTTPYTSFIAVIEEVRNPEGDSRDVNQASPLPLGVSNLAVGGGYTAYSEPGDILFVLILTAIPLLVFLRRRRGERSKTLSL